MHIIDGSPYISLPTEVSHLSLNPPTTAPRKMSSNTTQAPIRTSPHHPSVTPRHTHAFLSLPGEVRNLIYDHTFHATLLPILSPRFGLFHIDHRTDTGLLLTCRQIHAELSSRYLPFRYAQTPVVYSRHDDGPNQERWLWMLDAVDIARGCDVAFLETLSCQGAQSRARTRTGTLDAVVSLNTLRMAARQIVNTVRAPVLGGEEDSTAPDTRELDRALEFIKLTVLRLRRRPLVRWRILLDRVGHRYRGTLPSFMRSCTSGRRANVESGRFACEVTLVSRDAERQRFVRILAEQPLLRMWGFRSEYRVEWDRASVEELAWMSEDTEVLREGETIESAVRGMVDGGPHYLHWM
ncbi:hypothetical protein K491DRAFT_327235 [Lophiostoma macrostomum CBS 122681]|uniref:F-box domain-containing protein n=1 Tax=Lophiostoma macrostomum CBS 122681 TaxID=1314788 RepID=A0A6A6TBT1_9PLEO|nr:hypothetical protein K491DRAFT_327235 [Lophiostoma macrostomum CBS 122681]